MGSHIVEVLRQGLWASLTGGWFYDPHLSLFSNAFHLYIWLILFFTPLVLQLTIPAFSSPPLAWGVYCLVIGLIFVMIKIVNYQLHTLFDTSEKIEAPPGSTTNDSWTRTAQSVSPTSLEHIEMNNLGQSDSVRGSQASPAENLSNRETNLNIVTADIERRAGEGAEKANVPTITSLEDITSMEDITSLEDLQLDELKTDTVAPDTNSPDRVRQFRRTVKAMSTQVTPQTSPLIGYKRRALSQERWPAPFLSGATPPPTLKRQQPHYHSQRVTRRRNATYRRRSKSVLDSPHGSHMLVGESRAEEQPPLTLEWAGYPHPSPRPRHRHRQMSLEEPLPGSAGRRYSLDLKPPRGGRPRDRYGVATQSSNILLRTDSERLEDIKALRDNLLGQTHNRKISTVSEPADPFGESDTSDDSGRFVIRSQSVTKPELKPGKEAGVQSETIAKQGIKPSKEAWNNPLPAETLEPPVHPLTQGKDVNTPHFPETTSVSDSSNVQPKSTNDIVELEKEVKPGSGDCRQDTDKELAIEKNSSTGVNSSNNNNENGEGRNASNSSKLAGGRPSSAGGYHQMHSEPSDTTAGLSVVEEMVEPERPRNPTPTSAAAMTSGEEAAAGGAIPKKGSKYERDRLRGGSKDNRGRTRHVSADANLHEREGDVKVGKEGNPSPTSSASGSENASLLAATKASLDDTEHSQLFDQPGGLLKRRPAVRRHTTAENRSSVRRARYYESRSSFGSRRSSHSHRHSDSEPAAADSHPDQPTSEQWHFFKDSDGCWYKYTFDSTSDGFPINLGKDFRPWASSGEDEVLDDSSQPNHLDFRTGNNLFSVEDDNNELPYEYIHNIHRANLGSFGIGNIMRSRLNTGRRDSDTSSESTIERMVTPTPARPKQFYKWKINSKLPAIKIWLDRLSLSSLLDRNVTKMESVVSVLLAFVVAVLASVILFSGYYQDVYILIFCFVAAGCQYSLLKSVQPDAASPTHGYNNVIVYSRSFYFCLISLLIIALDVSVPLLYGSKFTLYGVDVVSSQLLLYARDLLKVLMLCLPLVFTFGLLPQVNTFLQCLLEQLEIHVFGGNGTTSLLAAAYTIVHSVIAVLILYGMAYIPIELIDRDISKTSEVRSHVTFSVFSGLLISLSYHYSRMSSDPTHLSMLIASKIGKKSSSDEENGQSDDSIRDPLPEQIRTSVYQRLRNDLIVCTVVTIFVFGIHVSTVFSGSLQPKLHSVLCYVTMAIGFLIHYLMGQLRKEYPWLCCSHPLLKTPERSMFNIAGPPTITWFEKLYVWMRFLEKNLLYPAVFLSGISISAPTILQKFGLYVGPLVLVVSSFKSLRTSFSDTSSQYCVLALTHLAFSYDYHKSPEGDMFILNYALMLVFYSKFVDFYLKCKFIFVYIAPWQLAWGSAFHAFAQPLSVPHACMLFIQAAISALLYTPLNPLLGSAIFINSYMRPIKFWEKDYNTNRVDHSNIRLASQVDNSLGSDDNNLNSIFYEHLTRSLQKMLCGDLMMGRWGEAHQGDMFIMASDYLNALVHVIEMGNGLVTFQLRGLEFRGTYCQQREVEAITEGVDSDVGFCCCAPGHVPHFLSVNAAFGERWLAWEVTVTMYILDGYSITDNNAAGMLQVYDLRKVLITYYVKSVIFYTIRNPKLMEWIEPDGITADIDTNEDMASVFSIDLDEDFDRISNKVTQRQFSRVYLTWIHHCVTRRTDLDQSTITEYADSRLVRLCYALSLVARRALATAAHNNCTSVNVEFFLHGLHSLFKGDFRITGPDEWIFKDMEFLRKVISPAIRMALILHQDHFSMPDEYAGHTLLYDSMVEHGEGLVITHEADPDWRNAVLSNRPSLLALRHVFDEGSNVYKIIMLNRRHLSFRIIKVNRECVRGLWAGQQQELIFLRNRNPERGSIQNAKQALRNMINSSCDQPIGYPIYVSPLTTSYAGTNDQLTSVLFGELSMCRVKRVLYSIWNRIRLHCGQRCRNFGSPHTRTQSTASTQAPNVTSSGNESMREHLRSSDNRQSSRQMGRQPPPPSKPSTSSIPLGIVGLTKHGGSLKEKLETPSGASNYPQNETSFTEWPNANEALAMYTPVRITDIMCVIHNLNRQRRSDPVWPSADVRKIGGSCGWEGWFPEEGSLGIIIHKWTPCHPDIKFRSNTDKTILLVKVAQYYVPITEQGITSLNTGGDTATDEL